LDEKLPDGCLNIAQDAGILVGMSLENAMILSRIITLQFSREMQFCEVFVSSSFTAYTKILLFSIYSR